MSNSAAYTATSIMHLLPCLNFISANIWDTHARHTVSVTSFWWETGRSRAHARSQCISSHFHPPAAYSDYVDFFFGGGDNLGGGVVGQSWVGGDGGLRRIGLAAARRQCSGGSRPRYATVDLYQSNAEERAAVVASAALQSSTIAVADADAATSTARPAALIYCARVSWSRPHRSSRSSSTRNSDVTVAAPLPWRRRELDSV